ncbi:type II toxin-antitoxin system prevent-host-death family antitoxin [Nitrospirillum iridis]|uniref:Antitoxin (DNA-binding transcriptional repressor) of toxin-antitoxin stability system n=1 Tax=Nitrospirillum iridis TaxID=765888 RepID=A0A7X0AVV7_9PROT|nr:type II toxin-antitoxin system prevent-host-death family antitoxin [Nitrospirillum iridis]MBB6251058.1 antitoxin (DNA-binding transcriptional repressor) of toxin-antitoxin stability system [Nitrospirillum iridis]
MVTMISGREFNQNPVEATRVAEQGPVIVTDHGEPAFVLIRYDAYRRLAGDRGPSFLNALRQDEPEADFDFTPQRIADIAQPRFCTKRPKLNQ